ncbi:MarR family transcriptional regulator [Cryobacterium sp. TMT2-18-3]|uniref:MarR family winged helix-turn-helix transcriptional regulator n=1 Tax=unclassified Cryobacterium TaxID=2649013 RepID=UPI00106AAF85|nr:MULTISPECIES: MarR family transcriptional regulator [unclassified Cryobacterium]TFC25221.1 MarR family transcriptional regulator [Cryobacterium sp. TMT2-18-2]TFC39155.1 MarR family transcriptional regulator [Cryobacterium sp. TMT2-42-4]TFC60153.1 MarR family transcriptional regulator [Cryobacterium sp. TMT2-15-1]TFC64049.1 MarR family transcriptional regulator [Cryobacterium sp. TMT2-18-3]
MTQSAHLLTSHRSRQMGEVLAAVVRLSRSIASPRSTPFGSTVLTRTQLDVLFVLAHAQDSVTPGRLAALLHVTPGAITQLVDQLREHDLVEQFASDQDGRVRLLRLTGSARSQVEAFETLAIERSAPWFDTLTDDALTELAGLLAQVTGS